MAWMPSQAWTSPVLPDGGPSDRGRCTPVSPRMSARALHAKLELDREADEGGEGEIERCEAG